MKEKLIMNLQLFAEGDDYIEMDESDFTEEPYSEEVQEDITEEEVQSEVEDTTNTDEEVETPEEQKIRIKYNHEERELTLEEATQLAQKGMNYDKLQEKFNEVQNNPGLAYLNKLAERSGTTIENLVSYWEEQETQAELNQLIQNNIPEEYAKEMIENKKFREQMEQKERQAQIEQKQHQEFDDFFKTFEGVKPEDIPTEVWQKNNEGVPLKYAYMEHEYSKLKNEMQVLKHNQEIKKKAPIRSTVSYGSKEETTNDPFLEGFNSI